MKKIIRFILIIFVFSIIATSSIYFLDVYKKQVVVNKINIITANFNKSIKFSYSDIRVSGITNVDNINISSNLFSKNGGDIKIENCINSNIVVSNNIFTFGKNNYNTHGISIYNSSKNINILILSSVVRFCFLNRTTQAT